MEQFDSLHSSSTGRIDALKQGEEQAAEWLWENYYPRLLAVARRTLETTRRTASDEEDIAVSALKSFCARAESGRFPKLRDAQELWRLLVTITLRKAFRQRQRTARQSDLSANDRFEELTARTPDVIDLVTVRDEFEHLFRELPDDTAKDVVRLKLEGYTNREISQQVDRSLATVERKLRVARDCLTRQLQT